MPRTATLKRMVNKFPGECDTCNEHIGAGDGVVTLMGRRWVLTHRPLRWFGSPVSGRWVDGCPDPAEKD